jgi:hypothetical protein
VHEKCSPTTQLAPLLLAQTARPPTAPSAPMAPATPAQSALPAATSPATAPACLARGPAPTARRQPPAPSARAGGSWSTAPAVSAGRLRSHRREGRTGGGGREGRGGRQEARQACSRQGSAANVAAFIATCALVHLAPLLSLPAHARTQARRAPSPTARRVPWARPTRARVVQTVTTSPMGCARGRSKVGRHAGGGRGGVEGRRSVCIQ